MYFDREGKPMTVEEWYKKFSDFDYKNLKKTTLSWGGVVSTIWLGLDHSFLQQGTPLIFESMLFPLESNFLEFDMDRYSTEAEALSGHERMVKKHENGFSSGDNN